MKKLVSFSFVFAFAFILASLLFSGFVSAAPANWGIAINEKTRECGGYWAGDEYVDYRLPSEDWDRYYPSGGQGNGTCVPGTGNCTGEFQCMVNGINALSWCPETEWRCKDYCKFNILSTPVGECYFKRGDEELCCKQLGLTFVSGHLGQRTVTGWGIQNELYVLIFFGIIPIFIASFLLLILTRKLKITPLDNPIIAGLLVGLASGLFSIVFLHYSIISFFFALVLGFLVGVVLGKIFKKRAKK